MGEDESVKEEGPPAPPTIVDLPPPPPEGDGVMPPGPLSFAYGRGPPSLGPSGSFHHVQVSSLCNLSCSYLEVEVEEDPLVSGGPSVTSPKEASTTPASIGSPVQEATALIHQQEAQRQLNGEAGGQSASYGYASVLQKIQKWGDYDCYGEVIRGSRVVPMKTPLTLELQKDYLPRHGEDGHTPRQFTVMSFLEDQRRAGRKVGLIIDLSNHDCLYRSDLPDGVIYRHFIFVAKRLPDPENCRMVRDTIHDHLEKYPEDYVAMHCSYGFNRTGFVCCTYMIEELKYTVEEALEAFKESRPPGVKHQDFVAELRARYCEDYVASLSLALAADGQDKEEEPTPSPVPTPRQKNNADVNNDSLGLITGAMVQAELQRELDREKGQGPRKYMKDCSVS